MRPKKYLFRDKYAKIFSMRTIYWEKGTQFLGNWTALAMKETVMNFQGLKDNLILLTSSKLFYNF